MAGNRSDGNSPANVVIMEILSRPVASKLKLHLQSASCAPFPFASFTRSTRQNDNERGASDLDAWQYTMAGKERGERGSNP